MNLRQLRYICEIVHHDLRLSAAAASLNSSQPGVSKQVQLLEQELGVVIFRRRRNRILSITPAGKEIVRFAELALRATRSINDIGSDLRDAGGNMVIATTHTHARYTLPAVVGRFRRTHPQVKLQFLQGHRNEIFKAVEDGDADLAIGTDTDEALKSVALLACGSFHRVAVVPRGHPLLRLKNVTLEKLLAYPLITYGLHTSRWKLSAICEAKQVSPNVVFSAADADTAKAYVELGSGIAILPHFTYDRSRDKALRSIDVSHLFPAEVTRVGLSRERYIRGHTFDFLTLLSPRLTRRTVEAILSNREPAPLAGAAADADDEATARGVEKHAAHAR